MQRQQEDDHLQARKESSPEPNHDGILILDCPASRTMRNESLLFISSNLYFCYSHLNKLRYTVLKRCAKERINWIKGKMKGIDNLEMQSLYFGSPGLNICSIAHELDDFGQDI